MYSNLGMVEDVYLMSSSAPRAGSVSCYLSGPKGKLSRHWSDDWVTLRNCQAVFLFLIQKMCLLHYVTRLNLTPLCVCVALMALNGTREISTQVLAVTGGDGKPP